MYAKTVIVLVYAKYVWILTSCGLGIFKLLQYGGAPSTPSVDALSHQQRLTTAHCHSISIHIIQPLLKRHTSYALCLRLTFDPSRKEEEKNGDTWKNKLSPIFHFLPFFLDSLTWQAVKVWLWFWIHDNIWKASVGQYCFIAPWLTLLLLN